MKIGVLANSPEQLGEFVRVVQMAGYRTAGSVDVSQVLPDVLPDADVWFTASQYSDDAIGMLELFGQSDTPVVFDDQAFEAAPASSDELEDIDPPHTAGEIRARRARQLANKLEGLAHGQVKDRSSDCQRATYLWVLAASTGGPKAISEFLDGIPSSLSRVAFLYVQHINDETMHTLKQVVDKHSQFKVYLVDTPRVIREKTVYMVSPSMQIELRDDGVIAPLDKPWEGDYSPSIDQVIAKVARVFAKRGGAIIFTGMGDDGARSSKLLRYRGGEVWVQEAESCAIDSMPISVQSFTEPHVLGTPQQLAERFVERFKSA